MRYVIFSDVHGNIEALTAVLAHASRKHKDAWVFLGDAVGYGAAPNQVVERLRRLRGRLVALRGNHDRVVLDPPSGIEFFNENAKLAARWTSIVLTPANRRWLKGLHVGPYWLEPGVVATHGSLDDEDRYLFTEADVLDTFLQFPDFWIGFVGHTHVACVFQQGQADERWYVKSSWFHGDRMELTLSRQLRYLVNPGSVGQPRDRDWRPSYVLFDSDKGRLTFYRVHYDAHAARKRILDAGLPPILGDRLVRGV